MNVRWGVSPIAWCNDDLPQLGGATPLETILKDARDIGFEGIELGNKFPREASVLKPLLEHYSLSLHRRLVQLGAAQAFRRGGDRGH